MIGVQEGDRQYRRGMVLGLTMAEIMLLLIFLLLLLLSAKLLSDRARIAEAERQRDEAVGAKIAAEEKYALLERKLGLEKLSEKAEIDIIDELRKAEKKAAETERKYEEAKSALELLEPVRKKNPAMTNEEAKAEVERLVKVAEQIERQASELSLGAGPREALDHFQKAAMVGDMALKSGKSPGELIAGATCQNDLQQCQASNVSIAQQLALKGGTLPSCWIDPKTLRPQYIFTAYLRDDGIYLHDNKVKDREAEQAALPIAPLAFGRAFQATEFVQAGQNLFRWSDARDPACRFYVRLLDETSNDKVLYKTLKEKGVERVFFTLPTN